MESLSRMVAAVVSNSAAASMKTGGFLGGFQLEFSGKFMGKLSLKTSLNPHKIIINPYQSHEESSSAWW
jgi:hypothetical protein